MMLAILAAAHHLQLNNREVEYVETSSRMQGKDYLSFHVCIRHISVSYTHLDVYKRQI